MGDVCIGFRNALGVSSDAAPSETTEVIASKQLADVLSCSTVGRFLLSRFAREASKLPSNIARHHVFSVLPKKWSKLSPSEKAGFRWEALPLSVREELVSKGLQPQSRIPGHTVVEVN